MLRPKIDLNAAATGFEPWKNAPKVQAKYLSENGNFYQVLIPDYYVELLGFETILPDETIEPFPNFWRMRQINVTAPRKVFAENGGEIRTTLPIGKPTEPIIRYGGRVIIPIAGYSDGLLGHVTGHSGEKRSF